MKVVLLLLLISLASSSAAQITINSDKTFSYLKVKSNSWLLLTSDTILVDTLIMQKNSTIEIHDSVFMVVKNAFIDQGKITGAGKNGEQGKNGKLGDVNGRNGENGGEGATLQLAINFIELTMLNIDLSGGNGGNGGQGYSPRSNATEGTNGLDGGNGGSGGNGGNGGNLILIYKSPNFIPVINKKSLHSIFVQYHGGDPGQSGVPGKGGAGGYPTRLYNSSTKKMEAVTAGGKRGNDGISQSNHSEGKDGKIILKRI